MEIVTKKQMSCKKVKTAPEPIIEPKKIVLENEITEIRSEIKELKKVVNEILEMMKAVYEFENST
jgi:hypothetical protein